MRPVARFALALSLAISLAASSVALASWQVTGNPVSTEPGDQKLVKVLHFLFTYWNPILGSPNGPPDPMLYSIWEDQRSGSGTDVDLHAAITSWSGGTAPPSGALIAGGPGFQWHCDAELTGPYNGFLVGYQSEGAGLPSQVRAQRLFQGDSMPAWPDSGVLVAGRATEASTIRVVGDARSGGIVAWIDRHTGVSHVYAQRLDQDGSTMWAPGGILPTGTAGYQLAFEMERGPANGAYLTWIEITPDGPEVSVDFRTMLLRSDGTPDPAWPAGGRIIAGPWFNENRVNRFSLISAGASPHPFVLWGHDAIVGNAGALSALALLADGSVAPGWPSSGRVLSTSPGAAISAIGSVDDAALCAAWSDIRAATPENPSRSDIYAQEVAMTGSIASGWPVDGMRVSGSEAVNAPHDVLGLGGGSFIIAWDQMSSANAGPYAMRVMFNAQKPGWFLWPDWGLLLCGEPGNQQAPLLAPNEGSGAIAVWIDYRDSLTRGADLYAQTITGDGKLDVPMVSHLDRGVSLGPARPNPGRERIRFSLMLSEMARVDAAIFDVSGRRIRDIESDSRGPGAMTLEWDGRDDAGRPASAGILFLRVRVNDRDLVRRFVRLR